MVPYGAKAIPEGGWWSMPRLAGDGFLLVGDSAGFLNGARLKGIHLGDQVRDARRGDALRGAASPATTRRRGSPATSSSVRGVAGSHEELWAVRNFHQGFEHGCCAGMLNAGVGMVTGGRGWGSRPRCRPSRATSACVRARRTGSGAAQAAGAGEVRRHSSPSTSWPTSTTRARRHEEDQPVHLLVARHRASASTRCTRGVRQPLPALLPGRGLRDGARPDARGRARAAADQRQQLRPLQDLRHHGPLPDHHLGAARGRRRAELQEDVGSRPGAADRRRPPGPPLSARRGAPPPRRRNRCPPSPGCGPNRAARR